MARQDQIKRDKQRQADEHQRQVRRNQVIMGILSFFLILSLVLSLVTF